MLPLAQDLGLEAVMNHFHCTLLAKAVTQHTDPNKEDIDMILEEKSDKCVVVQLLSRVRFFVIPWTEGSTPGFPVHHQLLELAQTHVYQVGNVIQPSHPLSSPSHPAFNLSQDQGLFQ